MEKHGKLRMIKIIGVVTFNLICLFSIFYLITAGVDKKQAIGEEQETQVIKDFEVSKNAAQPVKAQTLDKGVGVQVAPPQQAAQPQQAVQTQPAAPIQLNKDVILIDDFQGEETRNKLGSRANVYSRAPSKVMVARRDDMINGRKARVLMIKYDKKNTGGPNGMGGWCGYYTLIKNDKTGQYVDGMNHKYITFWVKGEKGDENFMVGLADEHWDKIGDSLKSEEIGAYLEKGKITTQWQKAKVPLTAFFLDQATLSSISINFEADCFPEGAGVGVVFIGDIALEK